MSEITSLLDIKDSSEKPQKQSQEDNEELYVFGIIQRSDKLRLKVSYRRYLTSKFISIKEEFLADDNQWHPTKKGISIGKETSMAEQLREILQVAIDYLDNL